MSDAAAKLTTARQCLRARRGEEALKAANEAAELFKKSGNKRGAADALGVSIAATAVKGQASEAKSTATSELEKCKASGSKVGQVALLQALAEVALIEERPAAALASAQDAEALFAEPGGDQGGAASVYLTLADAQLAGENPKAALAAASKAMQSATAAGDKQGEANAWVALMRARAGLSKFAEAAKAAEGALVTCLDIGDLDGKAVALYRLAQVHNKSKQYTKAMKSGGMAMEHFRQHGSTMLEQACLAEIVSGLIGMEAKAEALRQARQGQAQLQKAGDRRMAALATASIIRAYFADSKYKEAVIAAKDALAIFRELGDREHEGTMLVELASVYAQLGQLDLSKDAAAEALPLFKDAGNTAGEVRALELMGAVEDAKVALQQEKEWQEDKRKLLEAVKTALVNREAADFKEALTAVYKNGYIEAEDLEVTLTPVFERDPAGATEFWEENHPEEFPLPKQFLDAEDFGAETSFKFLKTFDRRQLYLGMRFGGMGYGPAFRLLKTAHRKGPQGYWAHGHSTLTLKDDHADWEEKAGWHAGILDCALQTGSVRAQ